MILTPREHQALRLLEVSSLSAERLREMLTDAIALLADMGEAITKHQRHSPCDECEELLARLTGLDEASS